jgi:membrane protease subunit HflK
VGIGFRTSDVPPSRKQTDALGPGIVEWTSSHEDRESGASADESLLLTADEVPVELTAEVTYRIRDLKQYTFGGTRRPESVLRAAAESVLRDLAAQSSLDQLLTDRRAALERKSLVWLQERIDTYGLGVQVLDLQWLDVHPPKGVVPAYRQVADALEERELLINEADAYADRILLGAVGEAAVRQLKQSTQSPVDASSRHEWKLDDTLWQQLMRVQSDGQSLLSGNAAAILNEAKANAVKRTSAAEADAGRLQKLLAQYRKSPQLTMSNLYWDVVTQTLASRPLTIIDPQAANRQQIWLGEPPSAAMPAPPIIQSEPIPE